MFTLLALYGILIVAIILKKGGKIMANTYQNTLSVSIAEKDKKFLEQACYCLNQARQNSCEVRVRHNSGRIVVYAKKKEMLHFRISFAVTCFGDELIDKISAIDALDKRKYYLTFSSESEKLKITVFPVSVKQKEEKVSIPKSEDYLKEVTDSVQFSVPLAKTMPVTEHMLQLFNLVKIKQLLTATNRTMEISAIGNDTSISLKFGIISNDTELMDYYFRFNYLNTVGGVRNNFRIIDLGTKLPKSLKITVFAEPEKVATFNAALDLVNSITKKEE